MSDRLFVGTRKGLFELGRGGRAWEVRSVNFLGDPVTSVLREPGGRIWAALDLGHFGVKLWVSEDDGGTWAERPAPAFPPKPEGEDPHAWTVKSVFVLEGGKDRLWAGTIAGGLFTSTDGGASWALVNSLWDRAERREWFGGGTEHPAIHSVDLDPRDPRRLAIGISCGGVWLSADAGETWELGGKGLYAEFMPPGQRENPNIQDVHRLARCAAAPERLWCQHHNGVFRSDDGGRTFTEITAVAPSKFGFAVAAHPKHADTAWFVPAIKDETRVPVDGKLVVAKTFDGGKSFEVIRRGLPQEHAYDLVYRHGLAVDESGERLAMGSTTGGFWSSDDGGLSWTPLAARLPPIACVRFG
jgi:hypothetical protein